MNFQPLELLNRIKCLKIKIVLQEMARVMNHMHNTPMLFQAEAINKTCYTANKTFLIPRTKKTSYELWTVRKPNLKYFRTFGNK